MVLGSQNLDTQSWKRSREVSVAVDDAEATARYDAIFDAIWARSPDAFPTLAIAGSTR
jgi:phosphatidylserine/phosphatidylglycerophosphate/cardiolipin synthase-like enzyme